MNFDPVENFRFLEVPAYGGFLWTLAVNAVIAI